jgi:hypothetical protein
MNKFKEIKMKKTITIIILLFTLTLAACAGSASQTTALQTPAPSGNSFGGNNSSFGSTPLALAPELLVGIFKLEGTPNAVTAAEAAQMVPLWQVYKDLTSSSSAAQQEIDALAQQIQGVLTPAQVQAITAMKLTRRDIFTIMQTQGIFPSGGPNASGTPRPGGGGGGFFGGGNGVPGGGQGFGNGQNLTPQQIATFQARRAQNGGSGRQNRIPAPLFDALIKLLQSKK